MTQNSTNETFHRQTNQVELARPVDANSVEFLNTLPPDLTTNPKRIWVEQISETLNFTVDGVDIIDVMNNRGTIINVKDYGAIGNGIEDDTAAITEALSAATAAGGGTVLYPTGDYLVTSTITTTDTGNISMIGFNAVRIFTTTVDLDFMFVFTNCPNFEVRNINFDSNNIGKSILRLTNSPNYRVYDCSFKNFKQDPLETTFRHALLVELSPFGRIERNTFENIGQDFGGSETVSTQYRSITVNTGCNKTSIINNIFKSVFQSVVIAEFPVWSSLTAYVVNDRVLFDVGSQTNRYRCIANNTNNVPTNPTFWVLEVSDVKPNLESIFNDNYNENVRDNAVYFLEYCTMIIISNNTFTYMNDEPIVIVGKNATITGNEFRNIKNKAIAFGDSDDIDSVTISNNMFINDNALYIGNFIVYRTPLGTKKVKYLNISSNIFKSTVSIGSASHVLIGLVDSLIINGNIFDTVSASSEIMIRVTNTVVRGEITNNIFVAASTNANTLQDDTATSAILYANNRQNCRTVANNAGFYLQMQQIQDTGSNIYGQESTTKFVFGTVIPTTGTWKRGDIVWNLFPASGTASYWQCTATGTPGTWLSQQIGVLFSIAAPPVFVGQFAVVGAVAYIATGTAVVGDWKQIT